MKKLTLEEMQTRLDNDGNIYHTQILCDDVHKTQYQCGMCGEVFISSFHTLLRGTYKICSQCARKIKRTKLKDIDDVRKEVISYGFVPLFNNYKGVHSNLDVEDVNSYRGSMSLVSIRTGSQISKFAKYNKYALYNIKRYCEMNHYPCSIPNQIYNGWDSDIKVICQCGAEYFVNIQHLIYDEQFVCVNCSKSKSNNEKIIEQWLLAHNCIFYNQYTFNDCKNIKMLKFDFYLPKYNLCIEVDGEGHYKPVRFNGISIDKAQILFEKTKKRDNIKNKYCIDNYIDLLRISYQDIQNENYKNLLLSKIH